MTAQRSPRMGISVPRETPKHGFDPPLSDSIQFALERNDCECDVCVRARVAAEQDLKDLRADRDRWKEEAMAARQHPHFAAVRVQRERADRLASAIYEYLLWEPRKAGHAAAHKRLRAALERDAA